jgi:hypothetical protein
VPAESDAWLAEATERFRDLVSQGHSILRTAAPKTGSTWGDDPDAIVDRRLATGWRVQSVVAFEQVFGKESHYSDQFQVVYELSRYHPKQYQIEGAVSVLEAALADLEAGYVRRIAESIRTETLSEFLDIAQQLFDRGGNYVYPAASLAGAVLEDHLCRMVLVRYPKRSRPKDISSAAGILWDAKPRQLTEVQRKSIALWEGVRNKADHGEWDAVSSDEIRGMLIGVQAFVTQVS